MIKQENLFFNTIQCICFLFWGIPEIFQKPFKILLLLFLFYISLIYIRRKGNILWGLIGPLIGIVLFGNSIIHTNFQTSVLNISLSFFCIPLVSGFAHKFTDIQKQKARKIAVILCFCMFMQLCIFRSGDGRPTLGYEINWSAAYLFIFYIYCDYIGSKIGKWFVIITSFLLLSRLLILSLIVCVVLKWIFNKLNFNFKFNLYLVELLVYISFFAFNVYFLANVEKGDDYDTSINRLSSVNDGSNMLRFTINVKLLDGLIYDENLKFGYGQIATSNNTNLYNEYKDRYFLMPHNELLDTIAEFGYIFTLFSWFFSTHFFSKIFRDYNYSYFIPILIYTLILWARFLVVPSIEMFFLLSLLTLHKDEAVSNNFLSK